MNALLRYGGVLIVLIGVAILAIPQFNQTMTNDILMTGLVTIVVGILSIIILSKFEKQ